MGFRTVFSFVQHVKLFGLPS